MSGGLIQLVAYGAQDVFLTGKPQRTFWKGKFARYSNFAIESIEQDILGAIGSNQEISVILKRNGDLVSALNFEMTFKRGSSEETDPLAYIPYYNFHNEMPVLSHIRHISKTQIEQNTPKGRGRSYSTVLAGHDILPYQSILL
jgi:hypothetical protein